MIKLLIFDAGDLLWRNSGKKTERRMRDFFEKYGIDGSVIDSRWKKILQNVMTGRIKYSRAVEIEFEGMGLSKDALKEWTDIHTKHIIGDYVLNPHVKLTLKRLRKFYKIAILTDEVRGSDHKILLCKRLDVDVFDRIFCSSEIGYAKPHKKAFFTVLNHFKLEPSEAIFVGHSKDEIEGARRYKIRTIAIGWDKGTKSDFYIKRFSEIPKILDKIRR